LPPLHPIDGAGAFSLKKYFKEHILNHMKIIIHWLLNTVAVLIAAYVLPGVTVSNFITALIVAVVIAVLNAFIRPILLVLTLPINIVTLGLFTLVINAFLIMGASALVNGFTVAGFWSALLFSLVLALVGAVLHRLD
jgi:putative membrane protein